MYELPRGSRTSRRPQYFRSDISPASFDKPVCDLVAVLNSTRGNVVTLHSTAAQPSIPITQTPTVQELLQLTDNDGRWDSFKCNGNGWWIRDVLLDGTLVMVSNGSYMASRHIGACSGTFVLKYTRTKQKATCSWAEVQKVSDNYRGELLGAIGFLSVIHAIFSHPSSKPSLVTADKVKRIRAWTDCNGVITHGNDTKRNLKQGQAHADLIYVIRNIGDDLTVGVEFKYVQGHSVDHIPYRLLTPI